MDTTAIREKLHRLIADAGDEKLAALFEAFSAVEMGQLPWWKDPETIKELDDRLKSFVAEQGPNYTLEDVDREINLRKSKTVKNDIEMNIQTEKIELVKMLLNTNNPKIIQSIKQIFKKEETVDFWDDLTSDQKKEIKAAKIQIKEGESSDYDSFMSKHR